MTLLATSNARYAVPIYIVPSHSRQSTEQKCGIGLLNIVESRIPKQLWEFGPLRVGSFSGSGILDCWRKDTQRLRNVKL
jgi:hypothetical protein